MPVNYAEVYSELEAEEARLKTELESVRAAKPAILKLRQHQENRDQSSRLTPATGTRFADMGATKAIPIVLLGREVTMTSREVYDALKAEGWTSESSDPAATVSATLSQLREKQVVEKVGEGWKLRTIESNQMYKSPNALALEAIIADQRQRTANASEQLSSQ